MNLKIILPTTSNSRQLGFSALFAIIVLSIVPTEASAQQNRPVSVLCISKHVPSPADINAFKLLSSELQPALFIENGKLNSYGALPVCLFTDIPSLAKWPTSLSQVLGLQLLQIKISNERELLQPIDLSRFSDYPDLKYIHILSEIDTSETAMREILKNVPANAIVFFTIDKPS